MGATFTRTNQFIVGQGLLLITGDLVIDTDAQTLAPSDLGVKKFVATQGAVLNDAGGFGCPVLNSAGTVMSLGLGHTANLDPANVSTFPVGTYSRLAFLAV